MPKVPYAAYLRVYEPLAAFPEPERSYWAEYAKRERTPSAQDELERSLADLLTVPVRVAPVKESADAFVTVVDGVLCVCPWRTRLRAWQALGEVDHWLMPRPVLDAALPPRARQRAAVDYERWREHNPDARPWIRQSLWHVPVRWFALFSDDERIFVAVDQTGQDGPQEPLVASDRPQEPDEGAEGREGPAGPERPGERSPVGEPAMLRYRTTMVQARRRVARGLRTVREAMAEGPLVDALTEVGRWLEEFHPRSLVELDFGGLVHTIPQEQLAADHSAAEVAAALAALAEGDLERAGALYEKLTDRWMAVRERQFAS